MCPPLAHPLAGRRRLLGLGVALCRALEGMSSQALHRGLSEAWAAQFAQLRTGVTASLQPAVVSGRPKGPLHPDMTRHDMLTVDMISTTCSRVMS